MSKKSAVAMGIIFILGIIIFTVPEIIGKDISLVMKVSAFILVSIYIVLSFELIHRGSLALLGATIIVGFAMILDSIPPEEGIDFIIEAVDFNTIGLLLGMMIIVAILGETGIFYWVGIKANKLSKGNLWKLMVLLCTFTAISSMFIDNVTTILLMVPVTLSIVRTLNVSPIPFILSQVLVSNVGGAATLIGDPPNIMIGSAAHIDFNSFLIYMGPVMGIVFLVSMLFLKVYYRKELKVNVNKDGLSEIEESSVIKNKNMLIKSITILAGIIILFSMHGSIHIEVAIIALGGASVLLVVSRAQLEKVLHEVDWATLLFFTGLFIIVGVVEHSGLIEKLAITALNITGGDPWITFIMVIWLSAISSAFVDNIPFTATMIPLVETLNMDPNIIESFGNREISPLWWALALGADLGGNGTLIGSSAGLVAVGLSAKFGYPISFNKWFKIGFPFMIVTLIVGTIILPLYLIFII